LLVNVAVLVGTVGLELQLVPWSTRCQDRSRSHLGRAPASPRATPRPPSSPTNVRASRRPPAEMSQRGPAFSYKTVDHPRSTQCFLSQAAPVCCNLWLGGHECETNSGRMRY